MTDHPIVARYARTKRLVRMATWTLAAAGVAAFLVITLLAVAKTGIG